MRTHSISDELFQRKFDLFQTYSDAIDALHLEFLPDMPRAGFVYLANMSMIDGPPEDYFRTKIGRSRNPKARARELTRFPVIMPFRITMTRQFWCEDVCAVEAFLHRVLSQYRLDGEWFALTDVPDHALSGVWYVDDYLGGLTFHTITGLAMTFSQLIDDAVQYLDQRRTMFGGRDART